MTSAILEVAPKQSGATNKPVSKSGNVRHKADNWPLSIVAAYARYRGPYTVQSVWPLLNEESLELYNGWLVWQEMTEPEERRVAANIQEILSSAARAAGFGQAYPDQLECLMTNGDVVKPDVCLISTQRFESQVEPISPSRAHTVLKGGPELVIEIRSPSNTRKEDREKRAKYFASGTSIVWDVEPFKHTIWVWEALTPAQSHKYKAGDTIDCPAFLPGWQRKVADFFARDLTAEQIVGDEAQKWRNDSVRQLLWLQAQSRFPAASSYNLETRLAGYNLEQLTNLATSLVTTATLEEWLANFPD